VHLMQLKIT